jgi:hypothetical protein
MGEAHHGVWERLGAVERLLARALLAAHPAQGVADALDRLVLLAEGAPKAELAALEGGAR